MYFKSGCDNDSVYTLAPPMMKMFFDVNEDKRDDRDWNTDTFGVDLLSQSMITLLDEKQT